MVALVVKDFGGTIPRRDPRLLPDTMAESAINVDLANGPLSGLPQPEKIIDLSNTAGFPVRRAYRLPGPEPGDADAWLPLPSEFSSVCVSPLANDTLHRIYWTNPPGSPDAGAWWNTYERIRAGSEHWSMGFIPANPNSKPVVTVSGGSTPTLNPTLGTVANPGSGYRPGTNLSVVGGTRFENGPPITFHVTSTRAVTVAIVTPGTGGTNGLQTLTGTTGAGKRVQIQCEILGGTIVALDNVVTFGEYTTNPADLAHEPLTGAGLTGAAISMTMGVFGMVGTNATRYTATPSNPVATTCDGPGTLCTLNITYAPSGAPPLLERSYVHTFVDQYGTESSPSAPSDVVAGPGDAVWHISNLPASAPAPPPGKNYPPPVKTRLYRTLTAATAGAQFYFVADLPFGTTTYDDTISDTTIVNNNPLQSTSWAPPPDDLDGLTAMPGGMLIGFSKNTIHFCEPNFPNAWPAGYDQSLLYPIVGLAVWQQNLIVLTQGFPSQGSGTSPSQFFFSQIQAPEPCIARGSIVTDLAGVYYASQNGLIMLNYFGMQNQTLSNMTRNIWLTRFNAKQIVACRHRAQYLAINSTDTGFMIDYTEQRMGIVRLSPFVNVVSVWNDVHTGDAYMCADGIVFRWDSLTTPALNYLWRSKQFYLPAPASLGACQISLEPAVATFRNGPPPPCDCTPPLISLPNGINALFRLYAGPDRAVLVHEQWLTGPRMIFRIPSGFKAFNWQFEIVACVDVHSVELASTMRELKKV